MEGENREQPTSAITEKRIRPLWRWLTAPAILVGGVAFGGLALTHGGPGTPVANASAAAGTSLSAAQVANSTRPVLGAQGLGGFRAGGIGGFGFGKGRGGFGGGLTVSGVNGNTITATSRAGGTVTITVTSSTTYDEAGASVALSAVQPGQHISLQGSRTGAGAFTATQIEIVLPSELGVVTNATASQLTITSFDGATHVINLTSSTRYQKAGASDTVADVTTGNAILATGPISSDGSLTADLVTIEVPQVAGTVSAATSGSYTITGPDGTSVTVTTTGSTVYANADGTTAQASALTNGTRIMAQGTLSADGKTLTALRITLLPASPKGMGPGGMGMTPPSSGSSSTSASTAGV